MPPPSEHVDRSCPGGWPVSGRPALRIALARCRTHARRPHLRRSRPCRQPDTFYLGSVGGGVWKTVNAGHTWFPISDRRASPSAPSAPSLSLRRTQHRLRRHRRARHPQPALLRQRHVSNPPTRARRGRHIGLEDTRHIGRVVVDPADPNRVYRRGAWPRLQRQPRARRLPLHRRRHDVEEGSLQAAPAPTMSAPSTSPSIPRIRASSTPRCGPRAVRHGRSTLPPTCPAADSTNPPTAATPGSSSPADCPTDDFVGKIGIAVAPSNPNRLWAVVDDIGGRRSHARSRWWRRWRRRRKPNRRRNLHLQRRRRHLEAGQLRESPLGPRLVLRPDHRRSR